MDENTINWQLLVQHFNDPSDDDLQQQVSAWLSANPSHQNMYEELKRVWELSADAKVLQHFNVQEESAALSALLPDKPVYELPADPISRYRWYKIAAAVLLASIGGYWFYRDANKINFLTKTTAQQIDSVILYDGSRIILHKNSSIRYASNMVKADARAIYLEKGTAFFDVQPNDQQAFEVHVNHSKITVLGTAFNVNVEGEAINVDVKSGKIKFEPRSENGVVLHGGQSIDYTPQRGITTRNSTNENADAWATKELVFVDASLAEVCKQLEDVYQVTISMKGHVPLKKLNATFRNNPLSDVFEVLEAAYPIEIEQSGQQIIITSK
ncbi:FecR family protein [Chitinophaga skermanii]|uniref:FecR family protein n=1 Tax=Chitinophaga skermanii TaxID=331697 RepID=A0A327R3W9_9BACT|nr:FecR domain-containing protein [Chitinophaga skermanii]RAJ08577.1 FecR family protein [Chitinophaga skermanii]